MKKQQIIFIVLVVLIAILFLRSCGKTLFGGKTIIKTDTVTKIKYVQVKADTQYIPEIIGVTNTIHVPKYIHDTTTILEVRIEPTDTAAILQRYFQVVNYSDTQKIKDYGHIIIQDSVTENRIKNRRLVTNLSIPEKTITITKEVKRAIGYFGFSAYGNKTEPFFAVGAGLSLKLKSDYIFGIGAMYGKDGTLYYSGQFKIPIRLKKR